MYLFPLWEGLLHLIEFLWDILSYSFSKPSLRDKDLLLASFLLDYLNIFIYFYSFISSDEG